MQLHSLPSATAHLTFDTVVPQLASTRHVAASAFYHCLGALMSLMSFLLLGLVKCVSSEEVNGLCTFDLVLATKDLLRLQQIEPYGQVIIAII